MRMASFIGIILLIRCSGTVISADNRDLRTIHLNERADFAAKATGEYLASVAVSPDGTLVAAAGNLPGNTTTFGDVVLKAVTGRNPTGGFQVWNVADGSLRFRVSNLLKTANHIAFSPDGKSLAVGYGDWRKEGEIAVCDLATKEIVTTLRGHAGWVRSLAYSPDGKTLISCGSIKPESEADGGELWVWDLETKKGKRVWNHKEGTLASVAFSPDGKWFAAGGGLVPDRWNGTPRVSRRKAALVQIWDANSITVRHEITDHPSVVQTVAFSPDSKMLVSASNGFGVAPRYDATLNFWDATTGGRIHSEKVDQWYPEEAIVGFGNLAFSPHGRFLAVPLGSRNRGGQWAALRLYNVERQALEAETPIYAQKLKPVTAAAFSPDGTTLVAAYGLGMIKLWDVAKP